MEEKLIESNVTEETIIRVNKGHIGAAIEVILYNQKIIYRKLEEITNELNNK